MDWARQQLRLLICATQFLTRVPTPALKTFDPDWITRSARYFPLVGQGVGAVCALVVWSSSRVWNPTVAALLAVGAGMLITGAFHEDGIADSADGLGGGQTVERRLEIMKDSRIGTYGVCALVMVLGLKVFTLASVAPSRGAILLLAAHGLGRAAAVLAMLLTPYAPDGAAAKWKPVPRGPHWGEVAIAALIAAWPLVLLPPSATLAGLAIGGILALLLSWRARRLIGGHTGDVLGAIEQVFELGFLLGATAFS